MGLCTKSLSRPTAAMSMSMKTNYSTVRYSIVIFCIRKNMIGSGVEDIMKQSMKATVEVLTTRIIMESWKQ